MNVKIYQTDQELSIAAAEEIITLLTQKPNAVICMASGNSPKLTCNHFINKAKADKVDTSQFFFIGLDEWVGVPKTTPGSCFHDFEERIFKPLNIHPSRYHVFDAMEKDLQKECKKMDDLITEKGGIDLMIVGIGLNGHIGFNEPGTDFKLKSHLVSLDTITISTGQKYFEQQMNLAQGITLGFFHLQQTKRVLLLANGIAKAEVIRHAIEGPVTEANPASIIQLHNNASVLIDAAAGSLLTSNSHHTD